MTRPKTTDHSHRICPTCWSDLSNKDFDNLGYFGSHPGPLKNDDLLFRYEEVAHLVTWLGALAQASSLAVAESEESVDHEWVGNLSWLARELAEETERRLQLFEEAAQIWKRRAEQSPERKEG